MSRVITRAAPAKINLYLRITGKREDGYHLLDSLIAFAGVGDTVTARAADDLSLTIDGPFAGGLSADDDNLVLRAAHALRAASGSTNAAKLGLTKNLPVSSGIGGGSADAAAALLALRDLWELAIDDTELAALGLALGADVPVCLSERPSRVSGIGDIIEPAPNLPSAWLVLANPGTPVSTPDVFSRRQGPFSDPVRTPASWTDVEALTETLAVSGNDLADAAIETAPVIAGMLEEMAELPGALLTRLSGSGATCFSLMRDEPSAHFGVMALEEFHRDWWIKAAPLLPPGPADPALFG